jgi:signal transduction histidine kinase
LRHELGERIEVVKDYGDLPEIECSPSELNQVFMSLLTNSIEAIDAHGRITIATSLDGDDLVLRFSDTGRGVPPEDLEHIFEPGFTKKGVGVGTGLGLSTALRTIEQHGGTIDVESDADTGTTMTLRIPCQHG